MAGLPYVTWVSDTGELEAASLSQMLSSLYFPFSQCIFHSSWKLRAGLCCCSLEKLKVSYVFALDYIHMYVYIYTYIYSVYICRWNITELSCPCLVLICKALQLLNLVIFVDRSYLLCDPFHTEDNATKTRFPVVGCVQILPDLWPFPVPTYILGNG